MTKGFAQLEMNKPISSNCERFSPVFLDEARLNGRVLGSHTGKRPDLSHSYSGVCVPYTGYTVARLGYKADLAQFCLNPPNRRSRFPVNRAKCPTVLAWEWQAAEYAAYKPKTSQAKSWIVRVGPQRPRAEALAPAARSGSAPGSS